MDVKKNTIFYIGLGRKMLAFSVLLAFLLTNSGMLPTVYASGPEPLNLIALGMRLNPTGEFTPPLLKGVKVYADNPFRFDFILDKGDVSNSDAGMRSEANRLIKYFLTALTIPDKDLWVNLSPYEKDRIVPNTFGQTEMGRDLVAQDYLLKEIVVSMLDPEGAVGKEFWAKVYSEAYSRYGTTDIPIDTFNKIWIALDQAEVFESNATSGATGSQAVAYVTDMHLKVLLQADYVAQMKTVKMRVPTVEQAIREERKLARHDVSRQILREVVIPLLEKEVNEGTYFAKLRQICHSLILATWYKRKIKENLLSAVYFDREKLVGVAVDDPTETEKIWQQYVDTFEKGARNYIKEERYQFFSDAFPRKFFTGGVSCHVSMLSVKGTMDKAMAVSRVKNLEKVEVYLSSVFRRNFRFGLDEKELANQFYDVYQKLVEANGKSKLRLSREEVLARVKIANQCNSTIANPGLIKTYAYMGYAALISALMTHLVDGEEFKLAAAFLFFGPVQTYFQYVGGGLSKLSDNSAFLAGMVMSAVSGNMSCVGEIIHIGRAGYFLSIMPAGNVVDEGITFPEGEVWLKRDLYNADFMLSENIAQEMARQFNLPNNKLFAHAYGYLMSNKLGFHDYTYFDDSSRKVAINDEQEFLELAAQLVSVVLSAIPNDLREQEAVIRKLSPVLLSNELLGAILAKNRRDKKATREELRIVINKYLRDKILNGLSKRDYAVPKFTKGESWHDVYGYALAKAVLNYYRDPDKSLAFLYSFSISGDVRRAIKMVDKKYEEGLYLSTVASIWWKMLKASQDAVDKKLGGNVNGTALRFTVSPDMLEQYRPTVGFDPVILNVEPLQSLSKFLSFSDS